MSLVGRSGDRLKDRNSWPRQWWYPPEQPPIYDAELWQEQFKEVSATIRRTMLALLAYAAFCFVTLGQPDAQILTAGAVDLPVVDTRVGIEAFMTVGPLVLVGLTAYLHIFLGRWVRLTRGRSREGLAPPYMFNLPSRTAALTSGFLFYALPPILLFSFAWKALAFTDTGVLTAFIAVFWTSVLIFLAIRRCPTERRKKQNIPLWVLLLALQPFVLTGFALALGVARGDSNVILRYRHLDLARADLSEQRLRRVDLRRADLVDAYLQEADLRDAALHRANLTRADLSGADLTGSVLYTAHAPEANFREADLTKASLSGGNLTKANLSAANLSGADLTTASLSGADLTASDLNWANLYETDLRSARGLTCNQLTKARNWEKAYRNHDLACGAPIPEPPPQDKLDPL